MSAWVVETTNDPFGWTYPVDAGWSWTTNDGAGIIEPDQGHSVLFTPLKQGEVTVTATAPEGQQFSFWRN